MLAAAVIVVAQTQQGYVKTIGRPGRAGSSLDGVVVRISGNINDALSNSEGKFSFPVREKRFRFSRISKKGYELADKDFLHYYHGYTPHSPITIALVSRAELQKEREIIEKQVQKKLEARFQKENAILEKKLERNQLTTDVFNKQLLALHEKYDNIDTLVSILSERYARTDYDNIDSLRLLINQYIKDGELERAQQLIKSKGDKELRLKKAEEKTRLGLQMQMEGERERKDVAEDYYSEYEISMNQGKYDSAYVCLENRYGVDTTHVNYLEDLALFEFKSEFFPIEERKQREKKHEHYLLKLYNLLKHTEVPQIKKADVEYGIGKFYRHQANYNEALKYYGESLKTLNKGEDKIISKAIGDIYYAMGEKEHALKEYLAAEKCYYESSQDSDGQDIKREIKNLYFLQAYIAIIFYAERESEKDALFYYMKAAQNAERYFQLTGEVKCIDDIMTINKNMEKIYASQGNYKQVYACAENAIHYAEIYMKRVPSSYSRLLYAEVLCRKADANANLGRTSTVEQDLIKCLKMSEFAGNIFKPRYRQLSYNLYCAFATNFYKQGKYKEALNVINKSIRILPNDIQAYLRKLDILKAIGDRNEIKEVDRVLKQIEEKMQN